MDTDLPGVIGHAPRAHARGCPGCQPPSAFAEMVAARSAPFVGQRRVAVPARRRSAGSFAHSTATSDADVVVRGAIVTMDPGRPDADALAVRDGKIIAVGTTEDVDRYAGADTEIVELGDAVCYPGFVEPHMHLWVTALFDGFVDCSPLVHTSHDSVFAAIADAGTRTSPGSWVCGQRWDPSLFPDAPPLDRDALDILVPDHPALVMNASMHFAYVNSAALEAAGLHDDSPEPDGGTFGRRNGRLDGVLGELAAIAPVLGVLPRRTHEEFLDAVVRAAHEAAAAGVTSVHEAGTGMLFGATEIEMLHELADAGRLPVRVTVALLDAARERFDGAEPGDGDDVVRITSWKLISDGSNQGRSGYLREPYLDSDERGEANYSSADIHERMLRAHDEGWQLMVHANGDAALDQVLEAYEGIPVDPGRRHRIEHSSLATDEHFARMAAVAVSPSFLMNHVYYWGRALRDDILGPQRAATLDAAASALRHDLRISFHSDFKVSPISPLRSVQTAVTRTMRDGGVLNAAECITVEQALRAVTIDAAWQVHADDRIGSLEVGKAADLVFLSADPRRVAPTAIADIEVRETRVGGTAVVST